MFYIFLILTFYRGSVIIVLYCCVHIGYSFNVCNLVVPQCQTEPDCQDSPSGSVCLSASGSANGPKFCGCETVADGCAEGQICDDDSNRCDHCSDSADCQVDGHFCFAAGEEGSPAPPCSDQDDNCICRDVGPDDQCGPTGDTGGLPNCPSELICVTTDDPPVICSNENDDCTCQPPVRYF